MASNEKSKPVPRKCSKWGVRGRGKDRVLKQMGGGTDSPEARSEVAPPRDTVVEEREEEEEVTWRLGA